MKRWLLLGGFLPTLVLASASSSLYRWADTPLSERARMEKADSQLLAAIKQPEYVLTHWIDLPTAPNPSGHQSLQLSLREAILLALRYNPNIRNAELDRIIQRYQLRLAQNEFELQFALSGTALAQNTRYSGVGSAANTSYLMTPEMQLKTKLGTQLALKMDNDVGAYGNYNPLLNLTLRQPLLRGFGRPTNEASLLDAVDRDGLNQLNLQQAVMDQITQVITAYRALILSGNHVKNQHRQLLEAKKMYAINEQKIKAGQLEPTGNIQEAYQIESLSLMVEQAQNEFTSASWALLQTIGLDPAIRISVPSDLQLAHLFIPDEAQSIQYALQHNAAYLALLVGMRADERAYQLAKNQQLWQLDATANVQTGMITGVDNTALNQPGIYNGRNMNESAGITLTIPFHDISRRSQLINAKVRLEKDKLNCIAAKRTLITGIKNSISQIASQIKQYELAKRQVDLAAQSYRLEKKKRAAGIASALDVNNTQNQLILAQMGLINAKIAYLNHVSALQQTIGMTLNAWHITLRYGE